ncbi:MAG: RnfABCDGE type electron transport complex subunit B, partial [Oscillospiraceae bacterium]|nr:RnfABCDGE type electron transport complex subunit B [Oscillospiraceae bacterium]
MNEIILPIIIVSVIAVFFGVLLVFASKKLAVEVDERVTKVRSALPGANCGGCGYASCDSYAEAIVNDGAPVNACGVGGGVAADAIANIMGVEAAEKKAVRAYVCCHGCAEKPEDLLDYRGVK